MHPAEALLAQQDRMIAELWAAIEDLVLLLDDPPPKAKQQTQERVQARRAAIRALRALGWGGEQLRVAFGLSASTIKHAHNGAAVPLLPVPTCCACGTALQVKARARPEPHYCRNCWRTKRPRKTLAECRSDNCACGKTKMKEAKVCKECYLKALRQESQHLCACGRPTCAGNKRCPACIQADTDRVARSKRCACGNSKKPRAKNCLPCFLALNPKWRKQV